MHPKSEIEDFMTPAQASKALGGIPERTLANWRSSNRVEGLKFVRIGNAVRYRLSDIKAFIESRVHPGAKPDPVTLTLALHGNPSINYLAAQCAQAAQILHQKSAQIAYAHEAVLQAENSGTTADQYLRDQLAAIQSEIAAFDADAAADFERSKAESVKIAPLMLALMGFENGLTSRRASLLGRIHGVDKQHEASIAEASRAGLSMIEMELLGRFEPPEISVAKWRTQIAEVEAQLAQIAAFSADPLKQLKHLAGLAVPGFEVQLATVAAS
jgi:hypothetical protein